MIPERYWVARRISRIPVLMLRTLKAEEMMVCGDDPVLHTSYVLSGPVAFFLGSDDNTEDQSPWLSSSTARI
jgi:hypothetical protein